MKEIQKFNSDRKQRIKEYASDSAFRQHSLDWVKESMQKMYVYNFDWLGRPIIQYPQDIVAVQELIWSVKPDLIIEAGIAHGGSLIMSASMLALLDMCDAIEAGVSINPASSKRKVVGLDVDIRAHNRDAIESHPMASRIAMIEGSSTAPETVAQVEAIANQHDVIMVFLDSNHTHEHVISELRAYGPLVSNDSYCLVFDTFIEEMPKGFFQDRPWDPGNNPRTAVSQYLQENPEFIIDHDIENKLLITVATGGFLKRVS